MRHFVTLQHPQQVQRRARRGVSGVLRAPATL